MLYSIDTLEAGSEEGEHVDHVVLLDRRGRPSGTMAKSLVHHHATPLHLAFSCHVVSPDGQTLITRRSLAKRTWPGVWSNACCGHPRLGETLREAVRRHIESELGCRLGRVAMALSDFTYRAEMLDGVVEHELCPVVIAEIDGSLRLDPAEADGAEWVDWATLHERARDAPATLSPWVVAQLARLPAAPTDVLQLLARHDGFGSGLLDVPIMTDRARVNGKGASSHLVARAAPTGLGEVDALLASFLAERQQELTQIDPSAADLGRAVRDLVNGGGKRLRPAFVYWGWRAARSAVGAAPLDHGERNAHVLGAAMELLHTFALLHDDVMDRAESRRRQPAARVAFADAHRRGSERGDPEVFGDSAATLAGDLAFVWADQLLDSITGSQRCLGAVREVFNHLRSEVIAGQYLDLLAASTGLAGSPGTGEETAVTVARLKSARYTVTRPLELGAALGGPLETDSTTSRALATYGDSVGLAFQMRDDVLDLFGDPAATGKHGLADVREGKRTVLIERALRLAAPDDARRLRVWLGDPGLSDEHAERCRDIVAASGALASVEALIAAEHRIAIDALVAIDDSDVRSALAELADLAVDRES